MREKLTILIIVASLFIGIFDVASAHSGKTDASGCHTVKKTGEYHCHAKSPEKTIRAKTEAKKEAKGVAKKEVRTLPQQKTSEKNNHEVVRVVDGDTVVLANGEKVRYIGVDTPETKDPKKAIQCFGEEASQKNAELVLNKTVKTEKDISDTDKYGRRLYYVWVGDVFVNDYLVRQGYAYAYTYPPDIKYLNQFVQAQKEAKEHKRGLWADNACKK